MSAAWQNKKIFQSNRIIKTPGPKLYFPILDSERLMEVSIDDLELSERARNVIHREGICTIGELIEKFPSTDYLRVCRNCGHKTVKEIYSKLFEWSLERYADPIMFFNKLIRLNCDMEEKRV